MKELLVRLAFSTLACPDWTFEQVVKAAQSYGYEGIELRLLDGEIVTPSIGADQRARIRRLTRDAGLAVCCVDTSFKLADPAARLEDVYGYLKLAAELESPLIRLFAGAPAGEAWETTAQRSADRLMDLAEHGRPLGVRVALETHDSFAAGKAVADVMRRVTDDYAGVLWDTLNPFQIGETAEQTYAQIGEWLLHIHIKDGGVAPDPMECRLLGEGAVPIPVLLQTLKDRGYDGWLSVEWEKKWQPQIAGPEIALPQYADKLRAYLQDIV
jgi:sugar phosphate isomerase/epimerase